MYKIKETIVVEGIYDKIKLSRFIDAVIIVTNGFCVFSDDRILESIKKDGGRNGNCYFDRLPTVPALK